MRSLEHYPCDQICQVGTEQPPMRIEQARLRCALPGFPRARWGEPLKGPHMGQLPILSGPDASEQPGESHDEGCPGAWYRCGFVVSLLPFERSVSTEGAYSPNIRLDRCHDQLVIDAIQYLEHERARALAHQRQKQRT